MCIRCERKSKRIGLPKGKFGKVKTLAYSLLNGYAIPLFSDKRLNVAIEAHVSRIARAKTRVK
jgi:hypothetical protein